MPPARVAIWVASIGALALFVRSTWIGAVPLPIALAAMFGYFALALTGVLVPQLEMFGDAISRGDRDVAAVALTFDDGPHPDTTPKILELLASAKVTATFFVIGAKVELHPEVIRAITAAGHSLGLHGYQHDRLYALLPPKAVADDIRKTQDAVERVAGVRPRWFRPPVGQVSPRTAAGARLAGVEIVVWSARGYDGLPGADPVKVAERIERSLGPGAIVLLHDAPEKDAKEQHTPASIEALPRVLDAIARKQLRVVPLEELIGA